MKGLSLTQPWATLLVQETPTRKIYETRSWYSAYRGLLAIHAAKAFPQWAYNFASEEVAFGRLEKRIIRSAIVGVVRLVDVQRTQDVDLEVTALERRYGDFTWGRWAFKTELITRLATPIPCRGALGLWNIPDDIAEQLQVYVDA
jgi:hypothetical protein